MRRSPSGRPRGLIYLAVTVAGVCGFIGLLVASHHVPQWATPLRVAALAWFVCAGVFRTVLFWRR
jgi:hypothetical protein